MTRGEGPTGDGADPAVAASLARGVAALRGGAGAGGTSNAAATATSGGQPVAVGAGAAVGGSAVLRGGPTASPAARPVRESLGGQVISGPGGQGALGPKPGFAPSGERIGRNDPCWCGSGVKYKKCHGR